MTKARQLTTDNDFSDLVKAVGKWSRYNFEDQDGLDEIAPFLGCIEEFLDERLAGGSGAGAAAERELDAFADFYVFLADLCYRTGLDGRHLSLKNLGSHRNFPKHCVTRIFGQTAHVLLKTRQGIRDFANPNYARNVLANKVRDLFYGVAAEYLECEYEEDLWDVVVTTWNEVALRDWKQNPTNANEIARQAVEQVKVEDITDADPEGFAG